MTAYAKRAYGSHAYAQDRFLANLIIAISESISTTESVTRQPARFRTLEETLTLTDIIGIAGTFTRTISELISASDDSIDATAALTKALSESIPLSSDSIARTRNAPRSISESVPTTESLVRLITTTRVLLDSLTNSDSIVRSFGDIIILALTWSIREALTVDWSLREPLTLEWSGELTLTSSLREPLTMDIEAGYKRT